ncbi:MAG TPA: chloride channel protein [Nevskiaceae bacterium]|nr:chloride channel protein [Nevskiaceae bacterium]
MTTEDPKENAAPTTAGHKTVRTQGSTDALPMAPALGWSLDAANMPRKSTLVTHRILLTSGLAIILGAAAAVVADVLMLLINVITDLCFYGGHASVFAPAHEAGLHSSTFVLQPTTAYFGAWVIVMPVIGGLLAGIMARWGSRGIQGHGIPEAMEQILTNESNVPPRLTWLKPLSSAFTIGTGGPFGAEGPIISTGGALGSVIGQLLKVTAQERKTLLAAGAAAGMAAVFGAPVASVAMAVELLLFELRPRSLIPVALATVVATGMRYVTHGPGAVFAMPHVAEPDGIGLFIFIVLGLIVGYASVWVTWFVYFVEDTFAKLPHVHWMWWPAIGAIAAGVIGYFEPATLGVGYGNIDRLVQNGFASAGLGAIFLFGVLKFISWSVSLGSGTSGGTLAPLFMIGGSMSGFMAMALNDAFPSLHLSVGIAALVGMGAMFAGSSRALLTAVIFCFETTRQPAAFLPLLGGCTAAYLISALTMKSTIMTEKIERRGVHVPAEYTADYLDLVTVGQVYNKKVVTLNADQTIGQIRQWIIEGSPDSRHHGYPITDATGKVVGVLTLRHLLDPTAPLQAPVSSLIHSPPVVIFLDATLRQASDLMAERSVGRVMVMDEAHPGKLLGILTRGDVIGANARRIHEMRDLGRHLHLRDLSHMHIVDYGRKP